MLYTLVSRSQVPALTPISMRLSRCHLALSAASPGVETFPHLARAVLLLCLACPWVPAPQFSRAILGISTLIWDCPLTLNALGVTFCSWNTLMLYSGGQGSGLTIPRVALPSRGRWSPVSAHSVTPGPICPSASPPTNPGHRLQAQ